MRTPVDYIGFGVLIWLVGAALAGLAAAGEAPLGLVLIAAGVPGIVGGVLVNIGTIAWAVKVGVRAAEADRADRRHRNGAISV